MANTYKITCRNCPAIWTAKTWAHCSVCHATFTGVSYFDSHRVAGRCWGFPQDPQLTPTWSKLEEVDGVWSSPEGHANREVQNARAAKARTGRTAVAKPRVSPEAISDYARRSAEASFRLSGLID